MERMSAELIHATHRALTLTIGGLGGRRVAVR
jgi:hypothetical protein